MTPRKIPPMQHVPGKVRLVKDCLRVGRWYLGDDEAGRPVYWHVTPALLDELVENFHSQWNAGHYHPLQWGHPAASLGNSEQLSIDYIRHLWREGNTLFFAVFVSPDVAAELTRKHRQVSVRVIDRFHTEASKEWGATLVHVAIVDHGAVPMQMPFKDLSARPRRSRTVQIESQNRFRQLASPISKPKLKGKSMDPELKKMLSAINKKLDRIIAGLDLEGDETEDVDAMTTGEAKELAARFFKRGNAGPTKAQLKTARKLMGVDA